ncbi:DUF368 domain-containing protein [Microbulbifer sp. 2205BS26-8]|uniref:DUF368 domain-containing protein n=1 Tax=Microbulbifer sp. 2205BS26-8 TaxID=3064386 RepID=UPI002740281B|nr:DUF368 domain-containing protein [Microbulbifer sp. 2205BS26-8]MDP5209316.1 DUF368 domain-containing protein [Microbulbifer sp. 2205BS26-8]
MNLVEIAKSRYPAVVLRGMAMGAADVVPGVSGGTIAFITGIYRELLDSLSQIGPRCIPLLKNEGVVALWKYINGSFLLSLFAGILISIFSLARLISGLLSDYPIVVWSFFFGLVLASSVPVLRKIPRWSPSVFVFLLLGALLAVTVSELRPGDIPATPLTLFFSGALAICAMVLPGISGAFILLLIGIYPKVLTAVHELQITNLFCFAAGATVGLILFSRLLSWLIHKYVARTLAFLAGILLGSLKILWPWKLPMEGEVAMSSKLAPLQANTSPAKFVVQSGEEAYLGMAVIVALAAILLVLAVDFFAAAHRGKSCATPQ